MPEENKNAPSDSDSASVSVEEEAKKETDKAESPDIPEGVAGNSNEDENDSPFASPEQRDMFILEHREKPLTEEDPLPKGRFADRELSWMRFN